jgi:purine-nucleoside phosphorylase
VRKESEQAAAIVREQAGDTAPDVGLVLGGGLAAIADQISTPTIIPYSKLPGFIEPKSGAAELVVGQLGTARVAVLKGRVNYADTGDIAAMRVPLETLALLGAKAVVIASAAGSTRAEIRPGALVAIRDHINLTGLNPILGEPGNMRSTDLEGAYDAALRERFLVAANDIARKTAEGVFMWFPGPSYETPAEINAARTLGADLVGMSTVPEVIMARQLGLRVLAVAMVTNYAAGVGDMSRSREQAMRVAAISIVPLTRVLLKFFEIWVLDSPQRAGLAVYR